MKLEAIFRDGIAEISLSSFSEWEQLLLGAVVKQNGATVEFSYSHEDHETHNKIRVARIVISPKHQGKVMMDIVKGLRSQIDWPRSGIQREAADEIERLRAEVAELKQILDDQNMPRKYVQKGGVVYCLHGSSSISAYEALEDEVEALKAKIDALMFEYCPEKMTPEQVDEWTSGVKRSGL